MAVDSLYTPDEIWSLIICIVSAHMERGMEVFCNTYGMCDIAGIMTGGKYSSLRQPHSAAIQVKANSWS